MGIIFYPFMCSFHHMISQFVSSSYSRSTVRQVLTAMKTPPWVPVLRSRRSITYWSGNIWLFKSLLLNQDSVPMMTSGIRLFIMMWNGSRFARMLWQFMFTMLREFLRVDVVLQFCLIGDEEWSGSPGEEIEPKLRFVRSGFRLGLL